VARDSPELIAAASRTGPVARVELIAAASRNRQHRPARCATINSVTGWQRVRTAVNWVNLMTPLGLLAAKIGRSELRRGPNGLWIGAGYQLKFPFANAFTLGSVITTKHSAEYLLGPGRERLLGHESRHSMQAAIFGPFFLPLYGLGQAYSWLLTADHGGRNPFERWAGLDAGGYTRKPIRPGLARMSQLFLRRNR
jgi:hypothetical protein